MAHDCPTLAAIIDQYNASTDYVERAEILVRYDTHRDGCKVCIKHGSH
jgi:hypothetical protein